MGAPATCLTTEIPTLTGPSEVTMGNSIQLDANLLPPGSVATFLVAGRHGNVDLYNLIFTLTPLLLDVNAFASFPPIVVNGAGTASLTLPTVPDPVLVNQFLFFQALGNNVGYFTNVRPVRLR